MEEQHDAGETHQSLETRSIAQSSRKSGRTSSKASTASSAALKARAKAEAARTQASFAKRKAEIMVEKATLKAKMHILQKEKDAATATAEEAVFVAAVENAEMDSHRDIDLPLTPSNAAQRTSEYVLQHSRDASEHLSVYTCSQHAVEKVKQERSDLRIYNEDTHLPTTPRDVNSQSASYAIQHASGNLPPVQTQEKTYLEPQANTTYLSQSAPQMRNPDSSSQQTAAAPDIAKYLMRRELVTSGLMEFDDQPENYWAWKTSFQGVTDGLSLTPREKLDLMIKWLGPESKEQAKRIRAIHSHNSAAGLNMVWQRLEDSYGTPEAVEHSLLKRIEEFPRISNRDNVRLRELGDLLLELEYAKEGGCLPGLAYLDTSRGVKPILEKLPFSLQEKWISQGSRMQQKEPNSHDLKRLTFKKGNSKELLFEFKREATPSETIADQRSDVPIGQFAQQRQKSLDSEFMFTQFEGRMKRPHVPLFSREWRAQSDQAAIETPPIQEEGGSVWYPVPGWLQLKGVCVVTPALSGSLVGVVVDLSTNRWDAAGSTLYKLDEDDVRGS